MKNTPHSQSRIAVTSTLILAMVVGFLPRNGRAVDVRQGDQVKVTREEPLRFHDEVVRTARDGESFTVLAYRAEQKKVFVLDKDKDGKDIALSVAEDAVALVTRGSDKLREQAITAAKKGKLEEAKRLIADALQANPADTRLGADSVAITAIAKARNAIDRAKSDRPKTMAAAVALRRNAAVVDRPNPLKPSDHSNHDRAEKMRREADSMVASATQAQAEAETGYQSALAAFVGDAPENIPSKSPTRIIATPGLELTPAQAAHNRAVDQNEERQRQEAAQKRSQDFKKWTQDSAILPPQLASSTPSPTYDETMEFINGMLIGNKQRMWFGKETGKMIMESRSDILIFDPKSLTPEVKFSTTTNESGNHIVELICTNGRTAIQWVSKLDGTTKAVNGLKLRAGDNIDRDKLVKACVHLIEMFGGEKDSF